jgi:lauroyl/myristoyl acyltransferase
MAGATAVEAEKRPLIRLKDVAWLIYLYPARWLALFLPLSWFCAVADWAAALGSRCLRGPKKRLLARLAVAFETNPADPRLRDIARQYFRNAILRFADDLLMDRLFRERRLRNVEITGLENLTRALSAGKGAVLAGGHFFASRLAKRYLAEIGYPSLSVRNLHPRDRWAGKLGTHLLQKRYVALISSVLGDEVFLQDPECSLKMVARLRSGGLIDCYVDAALSREVAYCQFLGQQARFPLGILHVARLAGSPLVPLHCLGNSRSLRIAFGSPILVEDQPDRSGFAEANLAGLVRFLEERIKKFPTEWDLWIRW